MKCGLCNHTDGLCYTTNPPKVKCNIDGEYKYFGAECNAWTYLVTTENRNNVSIMSTASPCLICGEEVPTERGPVICDKCKKAVIHVRKYLERDPCTPILD